MIGRVAASPYRKLDAVIDEATLISLEVDPDPRRVRLRLGVPVSSDPDSPWRERTFVLHGVSRVAALLRRVQYEADPDDCPSRPGRTARVPRDVHPPERVRDLWELNDWLHQWSGHELFGQPGKIFDAGDAPRWLGWARPPQP